MNKFKFKTGEFYGPFTSFTQGTPFRMVCIGYLLKGGPAQCVDET
jgi:hypothetical protein